jgi:hypothetical protein
MIIADEAIDFWIINIGQEGSKAIDQLECLMWDVC